MKVMILGYGRTGKSIENVLNKLNIDIITVTTDDMEQSLSQIYSKKSVDFSEFGEFLDKVNIIVNTIPALVLDKNELEKISTSTTIFDISSSSGTNIEFAKKRALKCCTL